MKWLVKISNRLLKNTDFCICNKKSLEHELEMKNNQIENLRKRINQIYYEN